MKDQGEAHVVRGSTTTPIKSTQYFKAKQYGLPAKWNKTIETALQFPTFKRSNYSLCWTLCWIINVEYSVEYDVEYDVEYGVEYDVEPGCRGAEDSKEMNIKYPQT